MQKDLLSIFKPNEVLSYYTYINRVLYTPGVGYYTRPDRQRVGYDQGTDFYTSMNVANDLFGRLVIRSIEHLLSPIISKEQVHLVEIGAEPGHSIVDLKEAKSFSSKQVIRYGEWWGFDNSKITIVFANELLDAQPFQRFRYTQGKWEELGVQVSDAGELKEIALNKDKEYLIDESLTTIRSKAQWKALQTKIKERIASLKVEESYILDYPSGAELLLQELVAGSWKGMMILFDYGYTWQRLSQECPQGTGRGYMQHQIINDLLQYPTQMDITCHICWDACSEILSSVGFNPVQLENQEKFLVQNASDLIQETLEKNPATFSKQRQGLMQLLHPGHMGRKFQVLWGMRL